MKRILSLLVMALYLISLPACSGKKPPDQSAIESKNILSVLKDLSKAYETKDLGSFMSEVAADYPNREDFSKSLATVFSKYETIHFNIQNSKMIIMIEGKGLIKPSFNWDAEWLGAGGIAQKNGGRATLVFAPGTFKLLSIDGKNPFLPQQQDEIPGKP